MFPFFRLIRIKNLLFIALIQLVMRQIVIVPLLQMFGFQTVFAGLALTLLIFSTVCIAAGGYVLNDYFDMKIDIINRPESRVVGVNFSRETTMRIYQLFTGIGVLSGLLLAYWSSSFTIAFIYIVIPGMLWFYSASYKRQLIIGNLTVAFASSMVLLLVAITEIAFMQKVFEKLIFQTPIPTYIYGWICGFAIFAFLLTFIREIIKDMQDEKGDREMECHTMPIKWGVKRTKVVVSALILFTILLLCLFAVRVIPFEGTITIRYISVAVVAPLIVLAWFVIRAGSPADFAQASVLAKYIMITGLLYSFIFYYLMAKTFGLVIFGLFKVQ